MSTLVDMGESTLKCTCEGFGIFLTRYRVPGEGVEDGILRLKCLFERDNSMRNMKKSICTLLILISTQADAEGRQWNLLFDAFTVEPSRSGKEQTKASIGWQCTNKTTFTTISVPEYQPGSDNKYGFADDHGTPIMTGWSIDEKDFSGCVAFIQLDQWGKRGQTALDRCKQTLLKSPKLKNCAFSVYDEGVTTTGFLSLKITN
jgi:hypothetical protein